MQAFAHPLLMMMARATPCERARCSRETRTGAACARFVVKTAAVVAGTRRNPEAAALMRELNAIGNNLNQIARHLNTTGEFRDTDPELLQFALDQHKAAIAKVLDL